MRIIKWFAQLAQPALEVPAIKRIRRNHGLEHATIHLLNRQKLQLSGRADATGFVVIGNASTDQVEKAAHEALLRLRNGQANLALHPNCGTNLLTTGLLLTTVAALGFTGTNRRRAWGRFPFVMIAMMLTALYTQPIGMEVQRYITTSGEPGDLEIVGIKRREWRLPMRNRAIVVHRVATRRG